MPTVRNSRMPREKQPTPTRVRSSRADGTALPSSARPTAPPTSAPGSAAALSADTRQMKVSLESEVVEMEKLMVVG